MSSTDRDPLRFRADIEGLRAVAVLSVLAFHARVPHLGGGYVGVDVFYVISGFLITQLMLRHCGEAPAPTFGRFLTSFYARRMRRILPAATLVLLGTLFGALLVQTPIENAHIVGDAQSSALFFSNIHFAAKASDYFAGGNAPSPFLQYWSLSLEEQFYLVWPVVFFILLAVSAKRRRARLFVGIALATMVVVSFVLSIVWMQDDQVRAFYLLPARAWELGIGALLALNHDRYTALGVRIRHILSGAGVLMIVAAVALFTDATRFPGWTALLPTLGTALVLVAGSGASSGGLVDKFLMSSPMQRIGKYSFSIYLWHWPILVLRIEHAKWLYATWMTRTGFMLALTLPAAAITFHLVEDPIRRARWLRSRDVRSVVVGALLIVVAMTGISMFQRLGRTSSLSTDRTVATTSSHLARAIVPTDFVPSNLVPSLVDSDDRNYVQCGSPCAVGQLASTHRIVLFGNSHAAHWVPAIQLAAETLQLRAEIETFGGCASYLFPVEMLGTSDKTKCEAYRQRVFASFAAGAPDLVVFSNMTTDVFKADAARWEQGIREALRRVPRASSVIVLSETPRGPVSIPVCLARNLEHADRCDQSWPTEINRRLEAIAREEGAHFVDLRPLLCTDARCPAITEDVLIYGDADHLTVPFSRARGSWMTDLLRPFISAK